MLSGKNYHSDDQLTPDKISIGSVGFEIVSPRFDVARRAAAGDRHAGHLRQITGRHRSNAGDRRRQQGGMRLRRRRLLLLSHRALRDSICSRRKPICGRLGCNMLPRRSCSLRRCLQRRRWRSRWARLRLQRPSRASGSAGNSNGCADSGVASGARRAGCRAAAALAGVAGSLGCRIGAVRPSSSGCSAAAASGGAPRSVRNESLLLQQQLRPRPRLQRCLLPAYLRQRRCDSIRWQEPGLGAIRRRRFGCGCAAGAATGCYIRCSSGSQCCAAHWHGCCRRQRCRQMCHRGRRRRGRRSRQL